VDDDRMLLDLVDNLKPDDGSNHFLCFHLMSVHEVGFLQDKYLKYQPVINLASYFFHPNSTDFPNEKEQAINMYDDRILQADDIIGQIMEKLGKKGYLKSYLGAFTADHGQRLGEEGEFGHGRFASESILRIPLLFFGTQPFPRFFTTQFATTLDIAPTLVDLAGLEIPSTWEGQSLLRPRTQFWTCHFSPSNREGNRGAVVFYDKGKIYKYSRPIVDKGSTPDQEKVYELTSDPEEMKNLIPTLDPAILHEMRRQARTHFVYY
jgi:arylsulfatase A-like enzyme